MRPTRTNLIGRIARQPRSLPPIRGHHVDVTGSAGVAVERDLLSVRRPARTAHRAPFEGSQLRLLGAVAVGDPDFLGARAIAHERDALRVWRDTEIVLVTAGFDQRAQLAGARTERHLEGLRFNLRGAVDHAAGLPRHARCAETMVGAAKRTGLPPSRNPPERTNRPCPVPVKTKMPPPGAHARSPLVAPTNIETRCATPPPSAGITVNASVAPDEREPASVRRPCGLAHCLGILQPQRAPAIHQLQIEILALILLPY